MGSVFKSRSVALGDEDHEDDDQFRKYIGHCVQSKKKGRGRIRRRGGGRRNNLRSDPKIILLHWEQTKYLSKMIFVTMSNAEWFFSNTTQTGSTWNFACKKKDNNNAARKRAFEFFIFYFFGRGKKLSQRFWQFEFQFKTIFSLSLRSVMLGIKKKYLAWL